MNVAHRFPDEIIVLVHIAINECDTKSSTQLGILFSRSSEKMREMGCDVRCKWSHHLKSQKNGDTTNSRCCREGKRTSAHPHFGGIE